MGTSARRRSDPSAATATIEVEVTAEPIESATVKIPSWHFGLTTEVLEQAQSLDAEAKQQASDAASRLYRMGQIALEMQNLLPHGNYECWIRDFTGYSRSTLFAWRSVAETLPNLVEAELKQIVPSALLQLGAKNTPDEVRQEALEQMRAGENLSIADIKQLKQQASESTGSSQSNASSGGGASQSSTNNSNQRESSQLSASESTGQSGSNSEQKQDANYNHDRQVLTSAKHHSHFTPLDIKTAVYECLGTVELDPCSNSSDPAKANIKAERYFTSENDGLTQEWIAQTLFINPPFSVPVVDEQGNPVLNEKGQPKMKSVMAQWCKKLFQEHEAGNVKEAIALVKGDTSTQWKKYFSDYVRCEYEGRATFLIEGEDGGLVENDNCATFAVHLYYLGEDIGKFYRCFRELGEIWQRIEPGMFGE